MTNSDEMALKVNELMSQLREKREKDEEMLDNIKVVTEQQVWHFINAFKLELNNRYVNENDIKDKLNALQKILSDINQLEDRFERAKQLLDYIREEFFGPKK